MFSLIVSSSQGIPFVQQRLFVLVVDRIQIGFCTSSDLSLEFGRLDFKGVIEDQHDFALMCVAFFGEQRGPFRNRHALELGEALQLHDAFDHLDDICPSLLLSLGQNGFSLNLAAIFLLILGQQFHECGQLSELFDGLVGAEAVVTPDRLHVDDVTQLGVDHSLIFVEVGEEGSGHGHALFFAGLDGIGQEGQCGRVLQFFV